MSRLRALVVSVSLLLFVMAPAALLAQPPCGTGQVLGATVTTAGGAITIHPDGSGQTFQGQGTPITVRITCNGVPLANLPADQITVSAPGLVFCPSPGSNSADAPTDSNGETTFTGSLCGGGCSSTLDVYAATSLLATVPVFVKSPDNGLASPTFVDASDLSAFSAVFGVVPLDPCYDFNHTGGSTIDSSDLAYFAGVLGASCGAVCP